MKTRLLVVLLLVATGIADGADIAGSASPSVSQLVEEAFQHNPELRYFEAEVDAARSVERRACCSAQPEMTGSVGRKRAEDSGGRFAGEGVAWSVGVMQTFEWPGRIGLRKAIANQDVLLAELGLARFRQAISARVRGQYQALAAGVEKARVAREVADRYRALREVLVQRDPSGITPQLELRILEATEITLRRRASESELSAHNARSALNLLLGRPPESDLSAASTPVDLPASPSRESLLAASQTNNFDLRLRVAELQQQSFRVSLTQNERWPAIKVGPQFSQENANGQDSILGLGISFPLPLWRNNSANVEAAHSRQAQAEALLNSSRREVERKVIAAAQAYETKRSELALWQPNSVATFAEAAALADRHYRLAAVPATTYVELQKQYLEAVETLLDTRREAILAASEIEELTGISVLGLDDTHPARHACHALKLPQHAHADSHSLPPPMIHHVIEFSLRQRVVVILACTVLLAVGLWSLRDLPIDAVPDITSPQVQVNTEVPALAPEEVEQQVTRPIEMELSGLPGVTEMRSLTKFGLSQVTLQFHDGVDIYRCRQLASERMQGVLDHLPPGSVPRLSPISTGLGEVLYYSVAWKTNATQVPASLDERLLELHEAQEYIVKPFLRSTPGIAEVNTIGGKERQVVVQPDPVKLRQANMTFGELADVIAANTENAGGGIVNREGRKLIVRAASRVTSEEEIADLPVKFGAGVKPLRVKDLADVVIGSSIRTGAATEDGQETVLGTAMMLAGENSRIVAHHVGERLRQLGDKLPAGIEVRVQYDRSELVDRTVSTVRTNLLEGAIFVVAILLGLLGNWRAALIVAAAIPLSFLCAILGMSRFGISGNLMSLGAVDFGLIIDGAVVIVENIVRQLALRQHKLGRVLTLEERAHTVLAASRQMANPMFFGVLIITVVYVPLLTLTGIEGKMFRPMALTVMLALGGALVLSITLMPVLCAWLLRGTISEHDNALVRAMKWAYRPTLEKALDRRWVVVCVALLVVLLSGALFRYLGSEFVPKLDEGSTAMMLIRPVGQSLEASVQDQMRTETWILKSFPEVAGVFGRIGTSAVATDPMPANEADCYIRYTPRASWRQVEGRPITKVALAELIASEIRHAFTNTDVLVAQPIEMRFNEMLEGVRADLSVKLFGPDFDVLEPMAEKMRNALKMIPGAAEVEFETDGRTPMLTLAVKRDALVQRNLSAAAVNSAVSTALAGRVVGQIQHDVHVHDIVVRMRGDLRDQWDQIRALPVRVGEHGLIALGELVELKAVESVEPIRRDDGKRRAALMVNLDTSDVEGFVRRAQEAFAKELTLPAGYTIEFGGQFENLVEARARLAIVVPAALSFIFALIFMAFGSLRQAMLVYTGIPLAWTGGILALYLRGMPFSITAAVGFIALSGVAVLNGVVLVSYFNELREEGKSLRDAVIEGAITRLRPVLMTAAVASLGFLPMALATGAGAEVQRPLATVVIGGILSSTFLTLVILPVLYAWFEARPNAKAA